MLISNHPGLLHTVRAPAWTAPRTCGEGICGGCAAGCSFLRSLLRFPVLNTPSQSACNICMCFRCSATLEHDVGSYRVRSTYNHIQSTSSAINTIEALCKFQAPLSSTNPAHPIIHCPSSFNHRQIHIISAEWLQHSINPSNKPPRPVLFSSFSLKFIFYFPFRIYFSHTAITHHDLLHC